VTDAVAGDDGTMISPNWLARALDAAAAAGAPAAKIRLELGIGALDDRALISRDLYLELWERLVAASDRSLPLRAGQKVRVESNDVLAGVCATVPTLGEAIHTLTRYISAWTQAVRVDVAIDDRGNTWVHFSRVRPSSRPGAAFADEFVLTDLVAAASWVTGRKLVPAGVHFPHPRGATNAAYRDALGVVPTFDARDCAVAFDPEQCQGSLLRHDPWLRSYTRASVEREFDERSKSVSATSFAGRVRHQLVLSFGRSMPVAAQVAKRLGCSERTLRRRLAEEGLSFTDVLDEARREEATRSLRAEAEPIADLAARLGFSHLSSFHRACVRWTGLAPGAFRASHVGTDAARGGGI